MFFSMSFTKLDFFLILFSKNEEPSIILKGFFSSCWDDWLIRGHEYLLGNYVFSIFVVESCVWSLKIVNCYTNQEIYSPACDITDLCPIIVMSMRDKTDLLKISSLAKLQNHTSLQKLLYIHTQKSFSSKMKSDSQRLILKPSEEPQFSSTAWSQTFHLYINETLSESGEKLTLKSCRLKKKKLHSLICHSTNRAAIKCWAKTQKWQDSLADYVPVRVAEDKQDKQISRVVNQVINAMGQN